MDWQNSSCPHKWIYKFVSSVIHFFYSFIWKKNIKFLITSLNCLCKSPGISLDETVAKNRASLFTILAVWILAIFRYYDNRRFLKLSNNTPGNVWLRRTKNRTWRWPVFYDYIMSRFLFAPLPRFKIEIIISNFPPQPFMVSTLNSCGKKSRQEHRSNVILYCFWTLRNLDRSFSRETTWSSLKHCSISS